MAIHTGAHGGQTQGIGTRTFGIHGGPVEIGHRRGGRGRGGSHRTQRHREVVFVVEVVLLVEVMGDGNGGANRGEIPRHN